MIQRLNESGRSWLNSGRVHKPRDLDESEDMLSFANQILYYLTTYGKQVGIDPVYIRQLNKASNMITEVDNELIFELEDTE